MRFVFLVAAGLVCVAAAASAEPATPEGAKAMLAAYAAYLPPALAEKHVVAVTAEGDDYVVAWDIEKVAAALDAPAEMLKAAPLVYRVTPTPGGGWRMRAAALPGLTIGPTQPGGPDGGAIDFDGFRFEGVYDPAAADFFHGKLGLEGVSADVKAKAGDNLQHVVTANEEIAADIRIRPGAGAQSVDIGAAESSAGSTQQTTLVAPDREVPLTDTRQGAATGESAAAGLRAQAFGDLWRFLVAHAADDEPPTAELKAKLAALPPLWKEVSGEADLGDIAIDFPGGAASVKSAHEEVRMTGLAETSSAELTLALNQATVQLETAPQWLQSLWPATLALTLEAGVDGLDKVAAVALEDPGFVQNFKLEGETKAKVADLITEGRPHVGLKAARLATPLVEATFEGEATFGYEGPAAHARITADTLDKVLATLAKVVETEPGAQQYIYIATYARGLAKTEDGRLVWDIEYLGPNSVEINGQKFPPE
jgi:hypothetical protein